jgi:hypothetical protein
MSRHRIDPRSSKAKDPKGLDRQRQHRENRGRVLLQPNRNDWVIRKLYNDLYGGPRELQLVPIKILKDYRRQVIQFRRRMGREPSLKELVTAASASMMRDKMLRPVDEHDLG